VSNLGQHDGDGIRYAMHLSAPKGGSAQMLRDPAGGWVSWDDYARLKAEVEKWEKNTQLMGRQLNDELEQVARLKAEVERVGAENSHLHKGIYSLSLNVGQLKDEVERLTKAKEAFKDAIAVKIARLIEAGDTMAMTLHYEGDGYALNNWNAAKEGKQP
jgi:uncharacterized small protein (DUF1192 family)